MSDDELREMEGAERENVEARIRLIFFINIYIYILSLIHI